ncbi:MAG: hypothetical protein U9N61_02830 [Euryarchaeota archaeon]|nr:hypothetical protein [Euryarchaeota archaeon]
MSLGNDTTEFTGLTIDGTEVTATATEINATADVSGRLVDIGDANTSLSASNSGKPHMIANVSADRTFTLPDVATGLDFELIADAVVADGHDWIIDTGADANYFTGGVVHLDTDAGAGGDEIVPIQPDGNSNSILQINLPDVATRIRFICDGTLWNLSGMVVSATAPAFSDQS